MSLRFIYGIAGTGKSEYCFRDISNRINEEEKFYVITPEQFSFTAEKKLLDNLGKDAVTNAEVLSFVRMAYRVISEVGGISEVSLSKSARAMLISSILKKQKDSLKFLGKTEENIDVISNAITEFKKHNVNVEDLKNVLENTKDVYLASKLQDMYVMYSAFEENVQNKYIDEDDTLTILLQKLKHTDMFNNTVIYIDEFVGFTTQEYELICQLLKVAKQVNITVCTDSLNKSFNQDKDIFFSNKETANRIMDIAKKENIDIEAPVYLEHKYRFKQQELQHLEENIYQMKYEKYVEYPKNIELFLAKNQFSEIEEVATQIIKLAREEKYRYNEISVIVPNIETYSAFCKATFNKYNIPVFIDEKKELNQNILVKYIISVLEIFSKNWSYEAMFSYIKNGFSVLSSEEIFKLENYCIKYGIKANLWYKQDWKIADSDEELEELNKLRRKVVEPLIKFKEKLLGRKNCLEISKTLYQFLLDNEIDKKLQVKIKKLENIGEIDIANEYKVSWDILIQVLDELVLVLGEEQVSFDEYTRLLKVGLQNSGLGKIPGTCDQVIVGDIERSRTHKVKAVFIVGLNDGQFPKVNKSEGFLNDKDRLYLKEQNIELAKTTLEALYEDNFNIYKAFSIAEEKLYLSYASADSEGKSLRQSMLIARLKKIFPKLVEKSDIIQKQEEITTKTGTFELLLEKINEWQEGKEIDPIWFEVYKLYQNSDEKDKLNQAIRGLEFTNNPTNISEENIDKLYGKVLKSSISRLEQYKRCAFSFYLKYGLQLSDKTLFKIQSLDTGSFMHDVIDSFFDQVTQREINLREITEEQTEQIVQSIINEKLTLNRNYIFTSTPKYKLLTNRLKRVILKSMKYIIQSITMSDFEILGNEVEFKENTKYPPIEITLDNGKKVEITGKIDRIDLAKNEDGSYVRIIDYKSSVKNIDLNEVMAGLQIQLLTYLDAVTTIENLLPAGVLYFNLIDPIIKANRNMTDEEIELEIKKKFKMQGLILADVKVARMMDKTLDKGASSIVPAYIDLSENLSMTRSSVVTKEQFEGLQKYMKKIIKQIAEEILSGKIELNPYNNTKKKKTPCEYCEYKTICGFNDVQNRNNYNYIGQKSKEEILAKIQEE